MPLFAREAKFSGTEYSIMLFYNDTACPGDAIFIRMNFNDVAKIPDTQIMPTTAEAKLFLDNKKIISSTFFLLSENNIHTHKTFLAGIPLSSWWTQGNYHLTVTYSFQGGRQMEFDLPFSMTSKTFNSESIPLDENNTSIRTDTSKKRIIQIDRLNEILLAIDTTGIYQEKPFTPPTTCTRRTSFFADRRVFVYSNGTSATSLHYGTDYGVPTGTSVTACADGKVVLAETRVSTGWSVVIEHLPGLYSLYYHLSELTVKEGDLVKMGDQIGLSGATGLATGPHLHWEMRLNTCAVNPDFFTTNFTFSNGYSPSQLSTGSK